MAKKAAKPAAKGGKKTLKGSSKVDNTKLMFNPGHQV
jgi:hypothetical protein